MSNPASLEDVEGVGPSKAAALREMGITTIEALAVTPPREMMEKTKRQDRQGHRQPMPSGRHCQVYDNCEGRG